MTMQWFTRRDDSQWLFRTRPVNIEHAGLGRIYNQNGRREVAMLERRPERKLQRRRVLDVGSAIHSPDLIECGSLLAQEKDDVRFDFL